MKNLFSGAAFFAILALGLLSDGLMDKLGMAGYIAASGAVLMVVIAAMLLADQRWTSPKT